MARTDGTRVSDEGCEFPAEPSVAESEARQAARARIDRYQRAKLEEQERRAALAQGLTIDTPCLDSLRAGLPAWAPPLEVQLARAESLSARSRKAWVTRRRNASTST